MPSTWEPTLRLELQTAGENTDTWGAIANANLERLAQAVAGYESLNVAGSGDYTITDGDAVGADTRNAFLALTGILTGNRNVIIPARSKSYFFRNATTGNYTITVKTASGAGVRVAAGATTGVFCDGTDTHLMSAGAANLVADQPTILLNKTSAAGSALLRTQTSGLAAWEVDLASGTDNDFAIRYYSDAGTSVATAVSLDRSDSGRVIFSVAPKVSAETVWHGGNLTPVMVIQEYDVSVTTSAYTFTNLSNYRALTLTYSGLATNVASRITIRGSGNNGTSFTDDAYINFRNYSTTVTSNSFDFSNGATPQATANAAGTVTILFQTQNSANRMTVFGNHVYMNSSGIPIPAVMSGTVSISAGSSFAMLLDVDAASGAFVAGRITLTGIPI